MSIFVDRLESLQSLKEISTQYSVFEEGQVLTSHQLNSLTQYLDDQDRLTRVGLLGVGIVAGLRVSIRSGKVRLTRGAGVTTDGDVLWIPEDLLFSRFKPYPETAPEYEPFQSGEERIPLFELIADGDSDPDALPLAQFSGSLGAMVAVLLMESYLSDDDLCSGTDCDNLGRDSVNTVKLLLTDQASAGQLAESLATPDRAARELDEIVADRPRLFKVSNVETLLTEYKSACEGIHVKLKESLAGLYEASSGLLGDLFETDPAPGWIAKLESIRSAALQSKSIQYYYDFLRDLAETHNAFRGLMFGVTSVCCPSVEAFPKHLLLGRLAAGTGSLLNRTRFYPSPVAGAMEERWDHARFLINKLVTMIDTFQMPGVPIVPPPIDNGLPQAMAARSAIDPLGPPPNQDEGPLTQPLPPVTVVVRVTPSHGEDRSLEERAIPFYYRIEPAQPLHRSWSYELERRGMSAWNYSYRAAEYGAQGGAAAPFDSQIGRFTFFRIEGHTGGNVQEVMTVLRNQIADANLPIAVRPVLLGNDRTKIVSTTPPVQNDWHRFHELLRLDAVQQLEDAASFSAAFKNRVTQEVGAGEASDGPALKTIAEQKNATITAKVAAATEKLSRSYEEFASDPSWKSDVQDVMRAAGEFKSDLGKVVKTEFATPFDTVISSTSLQLVAWMDDILVAQEEQADEELLFGNFLAAHPGAEHCAGVPPGGTFVLLYTSDGIVIADLTLPYRWAETVQPEPQPEPQPTPKVSIKPDPDWVVDHGISIQPSREKFVAEKLAGLKTELKPTVDLQSQMLKIFSDSVSVMTTAATRPPRDTAVESESGPPAGGPPASLSRLPASSQVGDELLSLQLQEGQLKADKLELLRGKALEPGADTKALGKQIKETELELAKSLAATASYVATTGMDISTDSEGFTAMKMVSSHASRLSDEEAVAAANAGLTQASDEAVQPELKTMINVVLRRES